MENGIFQKGSVVECTLKNHLILQIPLIILTTQFRSFYPLGLAKLSQERALLTVDRRIGLCGLRHKEHSSKHIGKKILLEMVGLDNIHKA